MNKQFEIAPFQFQMIWFEMWIEHCNLRGIRICWWLLKCAWNIWIIGSCAEQSTFCRQHFREREKLCVLMLKFHWYVPMIPNDSISVLVQVMAWCWIDKTLMPEQRWYSLTTYICVTGPQRMNSLWTRNTMWRHKSGPTLVQVMVCLYLNQYWRLLVSIPCNCIENAQYVPEEIMI